MLKIADLDHVYPEGTQALAGVTLSVAPGLFGLLGPNGAGKSTLMRVAATLQVPTRGTISFAGIDVASQPERIRPILGYLPQDFGVYPHISATELLDHLAALKGFRHRGERRDHVADLLARVGLHAARHRELAALSGGMRRRFGIAQALIGRPRLVIVDEPTAGLDPEERNRCLDLLAGVGEEAVVILSTHIVADVWDLCSRMAVLASGRVVAEGAPADLVARLDGRVWSRVVNRSDIGTLGQDGTVLSTRLRGGRILVRALAEEAPEADFQRAAPDLEDFYFATLSEDLPPTFLGREP